MIIPMFVDEKKDKELIDWLNSFTNRSAVMRVFLYQVKHGQSSNYDLNISKSNTVNNPQSEPLEIDDELINKFDFK